MASDLGSSSSALGNVTEQYVNGRRRHSSACPDSKGWQNPARKCRYRRKRQANEDIITSEIYKINGEFGLAAQCHTLQRHRTGCRDDTVQDHTPEFHAEVRPPGHRRTPKHWSHPVAIELEERQRFF